MVFFIWFDFDAYSSLLFGYRTYKSKSFYSDLRTAEFMFLTTSNFINGQPSAQSRGLRTRSADAQSKKA
jgi:hypothetical protein